MFSEGHYNLHKTPTLTLNNLPFLGLRVPYYEFLISVLKEGRFFRVAHRLHSSSFLGLAYRILNMHPKKELLCSRLGGSWILRSRVISRVTILITHIRGLITPLVTTHDHEPPSMGKLGS